MTPEELREITTYFERSAANLEYGEISVTIVIHDGRTKRIDKGTVSKELADHLRKGGRHAGKDRVDQHGSQ